MNSLATIILTLLITRTTMGAKIQNKRGTEESLEYNQQNQLPFFAVSGSHIQPYGIEAKGSEVSSLGGQNLNLLGPQLQDYKLPSNNIQYENVAAGNPLPSPTVKSFDQPPTTQPQLQSNVALQVPAVASSTLQLQVPAQVQNVQTASAPVAPNTGRTSDTASSSVTTQQAQNTASPVSNQQTSQAGHQNLALNEQNFVNLVSLSPSNSPVQYLEPRPSFNFINTFPLGQQSVGLQQGLHTGLLENYSLDDQKLGGFDYASLNSGFSGLNFNANLLSYNLG